MPYRGTRLVVSGPSNSPAVRRGAGCANGEAPAGDRPSPRVPGLGRLSQRGRKYHDLSAGPRLVKSFAEDVEQVLTMVAPAATSIPAHLASGEEPQRFGRFLKFPADPSGGLLCPIYSIRRSAGACAGLLLVMRTHPFAKKALTLHLARSEGHERYCGCNLMYRKVLASSHQHLMAEAPGWGRATF